MESQPPPAEHEITSRTEPAAAPPPAQLIETAEGVRRLADTLRAEKRLAIDTETNGLHAYRPRVCIIQVSDGRTVWLIDVLALGREPEAAAALAPLFEIFEDASVLKILHGASHDVASLKEDFGRGIRGLFDTYVAAQFLNYEKNGLASVVEKHCGLKLEKDLQKADWGRRPLEPDFLAYLTQDVLYLHTVHDRFRDELAAAEILDEAELESRRIEETEATGSSFNPHGFWRMRGSDELDDEQLSLLKRLYALRDRIAEKQNRPAFKVIPDPVLIAASKARSSREIAHLRFFTRPAMQRWIPEFAAEFKASRGAGRPEREPRKNGRKFGNEVAPRPVREKIEAAIRDWRKKEAEARKVSTMAVLPNHILELLVFAPPQSLAELAAIPYFGAARTAKYGERLISLANTFPVADPEPGSKGRSSDAPVAEPGSSDIPRAVSDQTCAEAVFHPSSAIASKQALA
jgi:ribonuclease D